MAATNVMARDAARCDNSTQPPFCWHAAPNARGQLMYNVTHDRLANLVRQASLLMSWPIPSKRACRR